jgi:hypothetical protein
MKPKQAQIICCSRSTDISRTKSSYLIAMKSSSKSKQLRQMCSMAVRDTPMRWMENLVSRVACASTTL